MNNYNINYFAQTAAQGAAQPNPSYTNGSGQQFATNNITQQNTKDTKPKLNKIDIAALTTAALAVVTAGVCLCRSGKAQTALNSLQQTAASLQNSLAKAQNDLANNQAALQKAQSTITQMQQGHRRLADNLLFPNGIKGIEFRQSNIGDCYLLSSLYALSRKPMGDAMIKKMVTMTDDGNFVVKFGNYNPITVTAAELRGQGSRRSANADIGVQAIERAYGKYRKALLTQQQQNAIKGYSLIAIDGGLCDDVLKFMNGNFSTKVYGSAQNGALCKQQENVPQILDNLAKNFDRKVVCVSTPQTQFGIIQETHNGKQYGWMDRSKKFICSHAYAVTNIDPKNKTVTIVNPHNTEKPLNISYADFEKAFDRIFMAC